MNFKDLTGLIGAGFDLGTSTENGTGGPGGSAQTSGGSGGVFIDTNTGQVSLGATATAGKFDGPPGSQAAAPPGNDNSASGGAVGGGLSFFLTNANCAKDLVNKFRTWTGEAGVGVVSISAQISVGTNSAGQPIVVLAGGVPTASATLGIGESQLNTFTVVLGSWNLPRL